MAIKMITPPSVIDDFIDDQINKLIKALLVSLERLGTQLVNEAKNSGTYKDRTKNLRNSIRYMVLNEGQVYSQGGSSQSDNDRDPDAFIREIATKFPEGIMLIVAAGKNYAAYVEALNYNVLTSSELLADRRVPEILKHLGFNT